MDFNLTWFVKREKEKREKRTVISVVVRNGAGTGTFNKVLTAKKTFNMLMVMKMKNLTLCREERKNRRKKDESESERKRLELESAPTLLTCHRPLLRTDEGLLA